MRIERHPTERRANLTPSPAAIRRQEEITSLRALYEEYAAKHEWRAAARVQIRLSDLVHKQLRSEIRAERRA